MSDDEKRSTDKEVHLVNSNNKPCTQGVGGRHRESQSPFEVGGYLDICNISDFDFTATIRKNDPRIKQLIEMGIGKEWVRYASIAGYEAFIALWVVIGKDESVRVRMPPFSKFRRFQRNQLIKQLSAEGLRTDQIKKHIKKHLCEDVSLRHIDRICAKSKIKK